ncbi:MAG: NusG domain II-containing protein [Clostridia bacterium]|nr:NusG domain II-containing protein [Clostridia bacterium]MBR2885236.1 NusG domain II-containing protein [Clostridia bacterium]
MKKGDFAVIALVMVLALISVLMPNKGSVAAVYVNGELYEKLPLDKDTQLVIESEFGTNTLVIENGTLRIINADCPNKQCEMQTVSKAVRSIVCLPNRLSVIIENGKNDNETDVII